MWSLPYVNPALQRPLANLSEDPKTMTSQGIPYYTVDVFTDTPFTGNPAAVCLDIDGVELIGHAVTVAEGRIRVPKRRSTRRSA